MCLIKDLCLLCGDCGYVLACLSQAEFPHGIYVVTVVPSLTVHISGIKIWEIISSQPKLCTSHSLSFLRRVLMMSSCPCGHWNDVQNGLCHCQGRYSPRKPPVVTHQTTGRSRICVGDTATLLLSLPEPTHQCLHLLEWSLETSRKSNVSWAAWILIPASFFSSPFFFLSLQNFLIFHRGYTYSLNVIPRV